MPQPFEDLTTIDRVVHEPARLVMLTALCACRSCDFTYLQRLTGLTKGNFSTHITKLDTEGLIARRKSFRGLMPHTDVEITPKGRAAVKRHWHQLEQLRKAASRLPAERAAVETPASGPLVLKRA